MKGRTRGKERTGKRGAKEKRGTAVKGRKVAGFLIEVGTEELPPGFQENLRAAEAEVIGRLTRKGVRLEKPELWVGLRRVALTSERVEPDLDVLESEVVGPPYRAAFDEEGRPTAAAIGFARKIGREVTELYRIQKGDREYVAGRQKWRGRLEQLLEQALVEWIAELAEYAEKKMRWGAVAVDFVRPIRWICAMVGQKPLRFEFAGVKAGPFTRTHRWNRKRKVRLSSASEYRSVMEKGFVALGLAKEGSLRELAIRKFGGDGDWSHHPTLPFLLEYPSLGLAQIPGKFMSLPDRLIDTVLKEQMKCLLERDREGRLTGRFAFTIDRPPGCYDEETVRKGYVKLAEARLTDASYFYRRDIQTPFDEWRERLQGILFLENVGSLADKVAWMEALWEGSERLLPERVNREVCRWVVRLCRNDQPTRMVREFTGLEGEVGRLYLEDRRVKCGVPESVRDRVALGVRDSYLPRGADDALPETLEGAVISALDKIVTLALYFQTGERPSGTRDPLGFRRVALGLLRVADRLDFDLPVAEIVGIFAGQRGLDPGVLREMRDFLEERWVGWARETYDLDYDLCQAVREEVFASPRRATRHALWLKDRVKRWESGEDPHFGEIVRIVTRVHNLAREAAAVSAPSPEQMPEAEEREMYEQIYLPLKGLQVSGVDEGAQRDALCAWLTKERVAIIDRFFDRVLVMHEDERIRQNRLNLIGGIDAVLKNLGALWKLERG